MSDFTVTFDFRTTKQNGVMFTISHPASIPALALEMYKGRVNVTLSNSIHLIVALLHKLEN